MSKVASEPLKHQNQLRKQAAMALASLHIQAGSPEHSLLKNVISTSLSFPDSKIS